MRLNYPASGQFGGLLQQKYELATAIQRNGIAKMLQKANISPESLNDKRIIDLGARNGDTTLGMLEYASKVHIIGVEEESLPLLIAKVKFGLGSLEEIREIGKLVDALPETYKLPDNWLQYFISSSSTLNSRVQFVQSDIEKLPTTLRSNQVSPRSINAIVGYQILHWLNCDETNLPSNNILQALSQSLESGGIFLAGTSTAFMEIPQDQVVDGMTKEQYSIDNHPYIQLVYRKIDEVLGVEFSLTQQSPATPIVSLSALKRKLELYGFGEIEVGNFLVTAGRDYIINEAIKLRAIHQGRLARVPENRQIPLLMEAILEANKYCDMLTDLRKADPRLVESNIYDVVAFIKATKISDI